MTTYKPIIVNAGQLQNLPTADSMNLGNYQLPSAIGSAGEALTVPASGTELEWVAGGGATVVSANATYYVATTGNDTTGDGSSGTPWATLDKAYAEIQSMVLAKGVVVTISIGDGYYTHTTPVMLTNPYNSQLVITGENTFAKSFTSVVSASGAAPDRATILAVNSTANISANDYALVLTTSGGTYTNYLVGMHKITNVDTGNTRITVLNKAKSTNYPSGNVTGNFTVLKTVLDFSSGNISGLISDGQPALQLSKLVVLGAVGQPSGYGIHAVNGGSINCVAPVGVYGFTYGVLAQKCGSIEFANSGVTAATLGVAAINSSAVNAGGTAVNGCTNYGFIAERSSYVSSQYCAAIGCGGRVAATYGSVIDAASHRGYGASTDWAGMSVYNSIVIVTGSGIAGYGAYYLYPATPYAYSTTVPSAGSWMIP